MSSLANWIKKSKEFRAPKIRPWYAYVHIAVFLFSLKKPCKNPGHPSFHHLARILIHFYARNVVEAFQESLDICFQTVLWYSNLKSLSGWWKTNALFEKRNQIAVANVWSPISKYDGLVTGIWLVFSNISTIFHQSDNDFSSQTS